MPDRDFAIRAVGPRWGPACRLYVLDGASDAAAEKAGDALARTLRETTRTRRVQIDRGYAKLETATAQEIESIEQLVSASLLAPSRNLLIDGGRNFEQIDAQQREMLAKMRGEIEHLARQQASGVTPRRAPKRRPSLQSVLSRRVKLQLER